MADQSSKMAATHCVMFFFCQITFICIDDMMLCVTHCKVPHKIISGDSIFT